MYDVVALGEVLIDFTPNGTNEMGMQLFARNPGGAPANVLAMNAKLGGKTAFIGKVGSDEFGRFLVDALQDAGIDISGVRKSEDVNTTLAFVQLDDRGDRSFSFYRKPGADITLCAQEIKEELIKHCRIFHFGSVSLTDEPSRGATLCAASVAKKAGALVSYDPNYRPLLWDNEDRAKKEMLIGLELADVVKVSAEEMQLLTGETDLLLGAKGLAAHGPVLVLISLGERGAFYFSQAGAAAIATYNVHTIDTTGAGDAFLGAVHYCLRNRSRQDLMRLTNEQLREIIVFANACGALTTTKKGAIPALPTREEVLSCIQNTPVL